MLILLPPVPMKDCKDKVWSIEGDDDVFVVDDVSGVDILPVLFTMKLPSPEADKPCTWAAGGSTDGCNITRIGENNNNTDKNLNEEGTVNLCLFSGLSHLNI